MHDDQNAADDLPPAAAPAAPKVTNVLSCGSSGCRLSFVYEYSKSKPPAALPAMPALPEEDPKP